MQAAAGGPQRKAQRSGFALERRSDGMSKLCPSGRSKGYEIRDAEGAGGGATMGGDAHRSPPPAAFWFLFRRRKRNSPKGRNPVRRRAESSRPTDVMVYGGRADLGSAPTTSQADYSRTGKRERQSPPLRDGGEAFCAGGCAKNTAPRRPFEKRAWRGLITTKCIIMCDF